MYDFAHGLSDYIEGITHSICTLEFEVHRPLYDWILESLELPRPLPHQYEFARLNLNYTVMSKRKLMQLVERRARPGMGRSAHADHLRDAAPWRDREAILRDFAYRIGITKYPSHDGCRRRSSTRMREEFNRTALRRLAVLRPIKVVITNYPEGQVEELDAVNNPEDPGCWHAPGAV